MTDDTLNKLIEVLIMTGVFGSGLAWIKWSFSRFVKQTDDRLKDHEDRLRHAVGMAEFKEQTRSIVDLSATVNTCNQKLAVLIDRSER